MYKLGGGHQKFKMYEARWGMQSRPKGPKMYIFLGRAPQWQWVYIFSRGWLYEKAVYPRLFGEIVPHDRFQTYPRLFRARTHDYFQDLYARLISTTQSSTIVLHNAQRRFPSTAPEEVPRGSRPVCDTVLEEVPGGSRPLEDTAPEEVPVHCIIKCQRKFPSTVLYNARRGSRPLYTPREVPVHCIIQCQRKVQGGSRRTVWYSVKGGSGRFPSTVLYNARRRFWEVPVHCMIQCQRRFAEVPVQCIIQCQRRFREVPVHCMIQCERKFREVPVHCIIQCQRRFRKVPVHCIIHCQRKFREVPVPLYYTMPEEVPGGSCPLC